MRRRPPVDAYLLAAYLAVVYGVQVAPATLRQWATRGELPRRGRDPHGRTLFDPDDAVAAVVRRGMLDAQVGPVSQ